VSDRRSNSTIAFTLATLFAFLTLLEDEVSSSDQILVVRVSDARKGFDARGPNGHPIHLE
jgi:hypothetical protein